MSRKSQAPSIIYYIRNPRRLLWPCHVDEVIWVTTRRHNDRHRLGYPRWRIFRGIKSQECCCVKQTIPLQPSFPIEHPHWRAWAFGCRWGHQWTTNQPSCSGTFPIPLHLCRWWSHSFADSVLIWNSIKSVRLCFSSHYLSRCRLSWTRFVGLSVCLSACLVRISPSSRGNGSLIISFHSYANVNYFSTQWRRHGGGGKC